jgi:transcriptional regulator with XRE-family HTH domain
VVSSPTFGVGVTLAEYVSRTLKDKKLSADEVAARSGGKIAANTVGKIARGETKHPSIPTLQALAQGMGEDEEAALGAAGVRFTNPWPPQLLLKTMGRITASPALTELVKELAKMDEKEIQKVLRSVKRK